MLVGFAAYVVLLGFERALLANPLVARSAAHDPVERAASARFGLTLLLAAALPVAMTFAAMGVVVPAQFGRGMLLFAPWLVPALVEDLARSILFRDGQGRSAFLADLTWLTLLLVTAPIALTSGSDWAVASCWGSWRPGWSRGGAGTDTLDARFSPTRGRLVEV